MRRYWVIKTRDDGDIDTSTGEPREHWQNFVHEGVVALGWRLSEQIRRRNTNLENITFAELKDDLLETSCDTIAQAIQAAPKILKFIREMSVGDGILLCRGYAANMQTDVHIYGFAKVKGRAWYDSNTSWWPLKRGADIWPRAAEIPKPQFAEMLDKGSLLHAIHEVSEEGFRRVCRRLNFTFPADS